MVLYYILYNNVYETNKYNVFASFLCFNCVGTGF